MPRHFHHHAARLLLLGAALLGAGLLPAQGQDGRFLRLRTRVTGNPAPGRVLIDRGERDQVQKGDDVLLSPRGGGRIRGVVTKVMDRSAEVALERQNAQPPLGTRGEVAVPRDRLKQTEKPTQPGQPGKQDPGQPGKQDPDKPKWQNKDEGYKPDMPLLAGMRPMRPRERKKQLIGRIYMYGAITQDREDSFESSFGRLGADMVYTNPLGRGGRLQIDGEFNYRTEVNEKRGFDFLPRRLSYAIGGTRFERTRMEFGRFLHHGMPELQVIDGVEFTHRLESQSRVGASIGFLPEPTDDFDTGQDFSFAGYYTWVQGQREELQISHAYQKTFHNGKVDRDLLISKVLYRPLEGWDFNSTLWIDYYYGKDDIKGGGFELTQGIVSTSRHWDTGNAMEFSWRRVRFPEIQRTQFLPILAEQIADNRYDRLSWSGWRQLSDANRFRGEIGVWDDEEDNGSFGELGIENNTWLGENSLNDFTVFATQGRNTTGGGARLRVGKPAGSGRWDAYYEVAYQHFRGHNPDIDDLLQHRFGAQRSFRFGGGWNLNTSAEGRIWDEHLSWTLGIYMSKAF